MLIGVVATALVVIGVAVVVLWVMLGSENGLDAALSQP
jgi:type IV secretory pathway VirB2 component (pilin)